MVSTVRPNANATPRKPMPSAGKPAASTAAPQPPKVSQNVPKNSAAARLVISIDFLPPEEKQPAAETARTRVAADQDQAITKSPRDETADVRSHHILLTEL